MSKLIPKSLLKTPVLFVAMITVGFLGFNYPIKKVEAVCEASATLIDTNKQAIRAQSIQTTDWNKYGVRFIFRGCITGLDKYNLTYTYKEGNGAAQQLRAPERIDGDHVRDIMFGGQPRALTYTYTVVGKDANAVSGGIIAGGRPDLTASLSVNFTSGPTMQPTGNPGGSTNSNTNTGSTNTNTPNNTNTTRTFSNLNTGIGIDSRTDYDQPIGYLENLLSFDSIPALIVRLLQILFALIGIVTTIVLMLAAFKLVTQGDNETERTKAKNAITWAIIGLVVSLMSFSIVAIIQRLITQG